MTNNTRLAESEIDINTSVSVSVKEDFSGATLHGHDFYELEIITAGKVYTTFNGKNRLAECGDVFLMTPQDLHEYHCGEGATIYKLQFNGEAISDELRMRIIDMKSRYLRPSHDIFEETVGLLNAMQGKTASRSAPISARLLECVLLLVTEDCRDRVQARSCERDLQKALLYIHEHFKENPTLV